MGTVLNYCTGAEETRVQLERTKNENEDLKRQLIESQERYSKLRQQNELKEKKKIEKLYNQKTKATQKLIQEKKQLYDKYSAEKKRISVIEDKAIRLAQENKELRHKLHKEKEDIKEEYNSNEDSNSNSNSNNEIIIQQEEEDATPRTDMVQLRNWLIYKSLKEKELKTELGKLLTCRNESHRSKIPEAYQQRYGSNIMDDISKIIKKGSNVYELVDGLFKTRAEYDAQCIHQIITNKNNKIGAVEVGEIICCRNINELQLMSHKYKQLYGMDMKDKIYKMSSGKTYQNIIHSIFTFTRNDNESKNKLKIAAKVTGDVEYLMDKNIKWKNFDNKQKLAYMLVGNNINYVHDLNNKYFKESDNNLTDFIDQQLGERSTSGQLLKQRIEFAADVNDFYARKIQILGDDGWRKTKEINRIFVSTFDNELKHIQNIFNQYNYGNGKTMIKWLNKQCKNEKYAFFLTKMLENCSKRS
eukprot:508999_1